MKYVVYYASAGCLADDTDPAVFDTLEDAARYVLEEFEDMSLGVPDDEHADWLIAPTLSYVIEQAGFPDPRPNSLYSWTIEVAT